MAQKNQFRRSTKFYPKFETEEEVFNRISVLSLDQQIPQNEQQKKIIVNFSAFNIFETSADNPVDCLQLDQTISQQGWKKINMKCFEMIYTFKYQKEENKIEIFHELLYIFSVTDNIQELFIQFVPYFQERNTSFQYQIGGMIKFAGDRNNTYAFKFLSALAHRVMSGIPEYSQNKNESIQLLQILISTVDKVSNSDNVFAIVKIIFQIILNDREIANLMVQRNGKILVDHILSDYDHTCEYMILKLIELSTPETEFLDYLNKKILLLNNQNTNRFKKLISSENFYRASLGRMLKQIQIAKNEKYSLQTVQKFTINQIKTQRNPNKQIEGLRTRALVEQFKKMRLSENEKDHNKFLGMYDSNSQIKNIIGRKLVKKNSENG